MSYVADVSSMAHPFIDFPYKRKPKKEGDVSLSPDPRYVENTAALLDAYGIEVRWNLMRHALELDIPGFASEEERAENRNLARVIELAERHGLAQKQVIDHVQILARAYHPVADWIRSKPWDGTDRLSALCATVQLAASANVELCSLLLDRWLQSCVVSVMPELAGPGRFAPQGVLVFQGPQGIGKTEWLRSLAPRAADWIITGRVIDPHSRDSVQQATSFWIVELGELDATYRKADIAGLKAFVTQDVDVYRTSYARREERTPRRTVLAASVNPRYYLVDDTGNRRWWTMAVVGLNWQHGIDSQQMWAQVAARAAEQGACWWLTPAEMVRLNAANKDHEVVDPLVEDLWSTWCEAPVQSVATRVTMADIWMALPGREHKARTKAEATTLANALRAAGVENPTMTHGQKTYRVRRISEIPAKSWGNHHGN